MPDDLTPEELTELERLHNEAMAPPWVVDRIDDDSCCSLDVITVDPKVLEEEGVESDSPPIIAYLSHPDHAEGLACSEAEKLICAMRNALPALIRDARALRRVEALPDKWREEARHYPDTPEGDHAAAAVRLCAREVEQAITTATTEPASERGEGSNG